MTPDLPPLPEPVRMSSDQAYLGFTADQMRAFRAEGERLARLQALEDAALAVEGKKMNERERFSVAGRYYIGSPLDVCTTQYAAAIRELKERT